MSVITDPPGRRAVQLEVEVPGTPEQVWHAIATGPGITSWFTPTVVEEREGGAIRFDFGNGQESRGIVTKWDPPRRFDYEERDWAPNAPPCATEITVEARAGGTCVVRMAHSLFTSSEDWDDQLESFEAGWPGFFEILKIYLRHSAGQPSATISVSARAGWSESDAWNALTRALGVPDVRVGQHPAPVAADVPPFGGAVLSVQQDKYQEVRLILDRPTSGAALISAFTEKDQVKAAIMLYLYGDRKSVV